MFPSQYLMERPRRYDKGHDPVVVPFVGERWKMKTVRPGDDSPR